MKQYNLSKIMKAAWNIRKNSKGQINFSECLKRAWKVAKNLVSVAAWFIRKKCLPEEMFYERMGKETDKAVLLGANSNGVIYTTFWAPKSICKNAIEFTR